MGTKKWYHLNTPKKNQKRKSILKLQDQKLKHMKQMSYNCHISDLVHAFANVENGR